MSDADELKHIEQQLAKATAEFDAARDRYIATVEPLYNRQAVLKARPRYEHSPDCGTRYRGCAPDCPKDQRELKEAGAEAPCTVLGRPFVVNPDMPAQPSITLGRLEDLARRAEERPDYHYDGRDLEWGKDLSPETLRAMKDNAEVFLLRDESGQPYSIVMCDACDTPREARVKSEPKRGILWGSTR